MFVRLAVVLTGLWIGLETATAGELTINDFKTLAVIYRGEPGTDKYLDDEAVDWIQAGFELGRRFYFLNSGAQFNVAFDWLLVDTVVPETAGPTYDNLEADLKARGIREGQYDGLIITGVGLAGNWGGFDVLGGTAACFGWGGVQAGLSWYPEDEPGVGYGAAWIFVHEFQHAVDLVAVPASDLEMLHAHPYTDRFDDFFESYYQGGEHFDWIALTFRKFDDWLGIRGVTNATYTVADADGDKFPDQDPRLPMDEVRFGSDPGKVDTDGDGLDDLGEYMADRYRGSDPRDPDTDDDGIPDDQDRYPTVAIKPTLGYRVDGDFAALPRLMDGAWIRNDDGGPVYVNAGWNEDALFLRFVGPRAFSVELKIDGSADSGYWQGGDTYMLKLSADGAKYWGFGMERREPVGVEITAHDDFSAGYALDVMIPAALGQGGSFPPDQPVDGLTLTPGRAVAFNVHYLFAPDSRALLTPHHTMFATRLVKGPEHPDRPRLRGMPVTEALEPYTEGLFKEGPRPVLITAAAEPTVDVLGVAPGRTVTIRNEQQVYGSRLGSGPVTLIGLPETGSGVLELRAETATAQSAPLLVKVKRSAEPPVLRRARDGEEHFALAPHGELEIWWGMQGVPVAPLAGATADARGHATLPLTPETLKDGWLVRGFQGIGFDELVFVDTWDAINRYFKGGPADPRLPSDDIAFTFDGYLTVETPGTYTFELECDDGGRLYVDGELVVNNWGVHDMRKAAERIHLTKGPHKLHLKYYENAGWAGVKLRYAAPGDELTFDIPVTRLPLDMADAQFFMRQRDPLGNLSPFESLKLSTEDVAAR